MATPAIPPVLSPLEPEDAASALEDGEGDDSAFEEGDDSEVAVVVGLDTELEFSEDEVVPSIVILAYGSQSELGTANGHVGSWQSDRS